MSVHIHPVAPLAPRVLLPSDPGRAMEIAIELLGDDRVMFNHNGGLWGYTGTAADGRPLTIQSTGIGAPSAAVVLEELAALGAEVAIRVGTCDGVGAGLDLGTIVAATSLAGPPGAPDPLSPELTRHLASAAQAHGPVAASEHFYDDPDRLLDWRAAGAVAADMSIGGLARAATARGVALACILVVTRDLEAGTHLDLAAGKEAALAAAAIAYAAIADADSVPQV